MKPYVHVGGTYNSPVGGGIINIYNRKIVHCKLQMMIMSPIQGYKLLIFMMVALAHYPMFCRTFGADFEHFVSFCSGVHLGYIKRTASVFYPTYILRIYPSMRNVECGMWNVEWGMWHVEWGMWNEECGMWHVEWGMWNEECHLWVVRVFSRRIAVQR